MQAQHRARVSLNQETPLIWTAILDAKTAVIQAASGNKATSLRRLLAINPSLTQTVSPHMRRGLRLILGLAQRETSFVIGFLLWTKMVIEFCLQMNCAVRS
jgi:hypothetical protein